MIQTPQMLRLTHYQRQFLNKGTFEDTDNIMMKIIKALSTGGQISLLWTIHFLLEAKLASSEYKTHITGG